MNSQCASESFGRKSAVSDVENQMKIAKKLEGIDPGFKSSGFVPKKSCSRSYDRQELSGANRAA